MTIKPPPSQPPAPPGGAAIRPRPFIRTNSAMSRGGGDKKDDVRLNERIRVAQVRLIDDLGNQVGVVPTAEALRMAKDKGLDLMEVASGASPPVCKIVDYGKFKYEKKKKEAQARKNQVIVKVKEIQLRPTTDEHDLAYKIRNARDFLLEGDKAKIVITFRGREITHTQPGFKMMASIVDQLKDVGIIDSPAKLEGKKLMLILSPNPQAKKAAAKPATKQLNGAASKSEDKTSASDDESEE